MVLFYQCFASNAWNAYQKMYITENGQILIRADKLLRGAWDQYWKGETNEGKWLHTEMTQGVMQPTQ